MQAVWRIQKSPVDCNIDHVPMQSSRLHLHCSAIILDLRIAVQGQLAQKQKIVSTNMYIYEWNHNMLFLKKSAQSCNTVHFLWQCEGNENVNSCNIIKHLRSRTCKSRHSTQDLLAIHVTFSSLSVRTPQPKKNKFDFSKTMFANEIVSFTISSISKSPTCGFVFVITC